MTLLQLIALLTAIVVVSSLVFSRVLAGRRAHYVDVMKGDLARLAAAESVYAAANHRYAGDTTTLGFRPSPRVTIVIGGGGVVTATGWNATATHELVPKRRCVTGAGSDTVTAGVATRPGEVKCVAAAAEE